MSHDTPISPLAPKSFPDLHAVGGVRLSSIAASLRYTGRPDLMLAELATGSTIAGVLTKSACPGAPVTWCRQVLPKGSARAIIVNAGNANVFTGRRGDEAVAGTAAAVAKALGCSADQVMVASTGVIGEPLPAEKIAAAIPEAAKALAPNAWRGAADAILTTDTFPKAASAHATIDGVTVSITGIAKGSGMIAPDMATMLSFVFTDAAIPAPVLQALLTKAVGPTFNSITVDSDTSTSDTLLLAATGAAGNTAPSDAGDPSLRGFNRALEAVLKDLALQVVRDGEGATKLIEVAVTGATSKTSARKIGLAIANSPLVKTAIAGEDANWGRIVMAVGKSGERADRDRMTVAVGGIEIARDGGRIEDYDEAPVAAHMKGQEIQLTVDVGVGRGRATVWTCDLTHGYISINADYRS